MSCLDYTIKGKRKLKCSVCGKLFITNHPKKKTCSDGCSMLLKERTIKEAEKDLARYNKKRGR